jgi:hypothetical protein
MVGIFDPACELPYEIISTDTILMNEVHFYTKRTT